MKRSSLVLACLMAALVAAAVVLRHERPGARNPKDPRIARPSSPPEDGLDARQEPAKDSWIESVPESACPNTTGSDSPWGGVDRDAVLRTRANESMIRQWARQGRISVETAEILLGLEHRGDALARNWNLLLLLAQGAEEALLRRYAIAALGLYGDDETYSALVGLAARDNHEWVRKGAVYALSTWIPARPCATDFLLGVLIIRESRALAYASLEVLVRKGATIPEQTLLSIADAGGMSARQAVDLFAESGPGSKSYLEFVAHHAKDDDLRDYTRALLEKPAESGYSSMAQSTAGWRLVMRTTTEGRTQEEVLSPIDWPPLPE